MTIIKRTVSGVAEDLKLVKNGKQAPKVPTGGTSRPSFTGSSDSRAAGAANSNKVLKDSVGYIESAPTYIGDTSDSTKWNKEGAKGSLAGEISVAKEDVTRGFGGKMT